MKMIIYNLKPQFIQSILDFDYIAGNPPSIDAIIHNREGFHKAFYGNKEILIPISKSLKDYKGNAEVAVNFSSYRSVFPTTKEALLDERIKRVVIVAEGVVEEEMKQLIKISKEKNKTIIGPATVGFLIAGELKAGLAGGSSENIIKSKLYAKGNVGLVTKSGGLLNEMMRIISRASNGVKEAVAIGGDVFPGSTMLSHVLRFEKDDEIKLIVALGEIGGEEEYKIIEAKKKGEITKPIIMYVTGTSESIFPWEVQFGHAAAKASSEKEKAVEKNKALREAGIIVPESFDKLEETIKEVSSKLGLKRVEKKYNELPYDFKEAKQKRIVRKPTSIISSVSNDEENGELHYNHVPISKLFNKSLPTTIGHLWFKRELPEFFLKFLEKAMILLADHSALVSGAHNAVVTSRAGKDIISSLCSGLLTIGPRFGGAIDEAMFNFYYAVKNNKKPFDFVEEMKAKGKKIAGIGHRVKSKKNPDKRVSLLIDFARKTFPSLKHLNYALEVEKITLKKSDKLILNVDGAIAALLLDAMESSNFSEKEMEEYIKLGVGNALFALSRSIGFIAHAMDQKRLNQPLYRHDRDDVLFL